MVFLEFVSSLPIRSAITSLPFRPSMVRGYREIYEVAL
jgi:hypothetical protein